MLILQITATGLGADKSNDALWKWFEIAHEWIVCGFTDLTGATIFLKRILTVEKGNKIKN